MKDWLEKGIDAMIFLLVGQTIGMTEMYGWHWHLIDLFGYWS